MPYENLCAIVRLSFNSKVIHDPAFRSSHCRNLSQREIGIAARAYHDANKADMSESRLLKLGMDSAMIHAMSQKVNVIAAQDPLESIVRRLICFVRRKMRT
ncbi:hypothetical protein PMIN05_010089 [Paraphaeosphaeria minitans]